MEFIGRVKKILPLRSGISQRTGNEWKSLPFIFENYIIFNQSNKDMPRHQFLGVYSVLETCLYNLPPHSINGF